MSDIIFNSNKCIKIKQFAIYDVIHKRLIDITNDFEESVNKLDKMTSGEILERDVYYTKFRRLEAK